jgi:hypothetical protein
MFLKISDVTSRSFTLLLLSEIITACSTEDSEWHVDILTPFKDDILGVVLTALQEKGVPTSCIACLMGLVSLKELLSKSEISLIVGSASELFQPAIKIDDDTRYYSPWNLKASNQAFIQGCCSETPVHHFAAISSIYRRANASATFWLIARTISFHGHAGKSANQACTLCHEVAMYTTEYL